MAGNRVVGAPSSYVAGIATAPGAGANIASLAAPPAGLYQVQILASIVGTPAPADANNMRLAFNGMAAVAFMVVPSTGAAPPVARTEFTVYLSLNGVNVVAVQAIAAGTAGAIYQAQITATKITGPG